MITAQQYRALPVLLAIATVLHLLCAADHVPHGQTSIVTPLLSSAEQIAPPTVSPSPAEHHSACEHHTPSDTDAALNQDRGSGDHTWPQATDSVVAILAFDLWPSVPTRAVREHNARCERQRHTALSSPISLCVWRL